MVTHREEMYYRLQIWHLHITYKTTTRLQLKCMVSYHPSRMVTHQKEVYYRLGIWQLHFTHKTDTQ